MAELAPLLATGLTLGAIYAVVGAGFVLIYNVTGIINFAQGEFLMLGALTATTLIAGGTPVPLALLGGTALAASAGLLVERGAIRSARGASVETLILITIGVSFAIRGIALLVWGSSPRRFAPFSAGPPLDVLGAAVPRQSIWVIGFTLLVAALLWLHFTRTVAGKAMRACAMNPDAARLQGISPSRMSAYAFALATGLAGAAGVVLVPITTASYDMGLSLALKGFTAAVIGGLVSPVGAIAGGLMLGVAEAGAARYISSGLKDAIAFGVLFAVLVLRPQGLLAGAAGNRV